MTVLNNYLSAVRDISSQANEANLNEEEVINSLFTLLHTYKNDAQEFDQNFFLAEEAFYQKSYEKALKYYLQCQTIPHFHFYCFRASAYVSMSMGQKDKALKFAKKAESIIQGDYFLQKLIDKIETSEERGKPVIGEKEIKELSKIFEEPTAKDLFGEGSQPVVPSSLDNPDLKELPHSSLSEDFLKKSPFEESAPTSSLNIAQDFYDELKKMNHLQEQFTNDPVHSTSYSTDQVLHALQAFQTEQKQAIEDYLQKAQTNAPVDDFFCFFQQWPASRLFKKGNPTTILIEEMRKTSGGLFFKWAGKGFVINPEENFLDLFHQQALSIQDIDFVIVTKDCSKIHEEVKKIHFFNKKINNYSNSFQVIHYYLNQKSYQELSKIIKPYFKQERHTVHSLELYLDSPDVEKIELTAHVHLNYYPTSKSENFSYSYTKNRDLYPNSLGITIELLDGSKNTAYRFGYISGASWSPLLSHYIGHVDLLIAAFGHTSLEDLTLRKNNEDCLGYKGTLALLEEVHPKILCCTEFEGAEGDIRLEIIRKLREDYQKQFPDKLVTILPAELGLCLDLKTQNAYCSGRELIPLNQVKIVKQSGAFGPLNYLQPEICL